MFSVYERANLQALYLKKKQTKVQKLNYHIKWILTIILLEIQLCV